LVSLPFVLGGALAAWHRLDYLLVSVLGVAMWVMATFILRERCPHCQSLRTRNRRIPYMTIVR